MSFAFLGANASAQSLEIWNAGTGRMSYIVETTPAWLSAIPPFGFSDGPASRTAHQIGYDSDRLPVGDHAGTITIVDVAARNNPSTVPVSLKVGWVRVVWPIGGESWLVGALHAIVWESRGPCDRVDIYLRRPGESRYLGSAPNRECLNFWWVRLPQDLTSANDWTVWVCWSSCPEVIRSHSGAIRVTPAPTVKVTWPAAGTSWPAGKAGKVTWTCSNFPDAGKLYAILWKDWFSLRYLGQMPFRNGANSHPIHLPKDVPRGSGYRLILFWGEDLSIFGTSEGFEVR